MNRCTELDEILYEHVSRQQIVQETHHYPQQTNFFQWTCH